MKSGFLMKSCSIRRLEGKVPSRWRSQTRLARRLGCCDIRAVARVKPEGSLFSMTDSPIRISSQQPILAPDGRQSLMASGVQRGVRRLFGQLGHVTIPELTLANGRRADLMALAPDGALIIIEIKSSIADFRADRKWPNYEDFCDRFYFAIPDTVPVEILPEDRGLIVADSFGAAIMREAAHHPLSSARRKAVTLRFARAAASVLHALADPDAVIDGHL